MTENELYEGFKDHLLDDLNYCLVAACEDGNLNVVKFLLTSPKLKINAEINHDSDAGLRCACQNGHSKIVQYLLTSSKLKKHSNISSKDNQSLEWAACHGHFDIVKFLMTSDKLKEHAQIGKSNVNALSSACASGHIHIVDYFLHSSDLKEKFDIHIYQDSAFVAASYNRKYDLLRYLIFDCLIEKTKYIDKHLQKNPDEKIENMFKLREIKESLQKDLKSNKLETKKSKI